jgi:hypothetical protein
MGKRTLSLIILALLLLSTFSVAFAQSYRFSLDEEVVHVFWNKDGTMSLDYVFTFTNQPGAHAIDYVDVGVPNPNYDMSSVSADIEGNPLSDIQNSEYVKPGFAVGLGGRAIPSGGTGKLHVAIGTVRSVLYPDSKDDKYASGVFAPTWFGSEFVSGATHLTVVFHLPPGVQPAEPRWHAAPSGWQSEPATALDDQGLVTYTWENTAANGSSKYEFGASFPAKYVPDSAIVRPNILDPILGLITGILSLVCNPCSFVFIIIVAVVGFSAYKSRRRSMEYLPPSIAIEGHGIKRGLTAVEASILMEQPMDKILTMILFSVLKKGTAEIVTRDPLKIKVADPLPEGLYPYEVDFLGVFKEDTPKQKMRTEMRDLMVNLVKGLATKMKGFSRKETVDYYKNIIDTAWQQVASAGTPEVKSQKFDENIDWAMADKGFEDKTRDVFHSGPVFVPSWWWRYDPMLSHQPMSTTHTASTMPSTPSSSQGGSFSMPTLPGGEFAAGMVVGMQNFAGNVVGNVTDFAGSITNATNPVPKTTSSGGGGGGGHSCACACACAGCACACAGGGR